MRYACLVCGMNHSRPCDAGLDCGILQGHAVVHQGGPVSILDKLARLMRLNVDRPTDGEAMPRGAQNPRS